MGKIIIILSLVFAIAGYFLGVVAEATRDTGMVIYYVSCGGKILCFLIAVLLAHHTGKNIRRKLNVIGMPGLRYVSWIMYGVAMVHFMLFFRWDLISAGNSRLPDGQINIDAAIFFIASMLMIAEVWTTSKRKD
jgi:membrane-bound acyltransferase YfiQ involved in biofilm formation